MAPSTEAQVEIEVGICKIVKWNVRHNLHSDGFTVPGTIFHLAFANIYLSSTFGCWDGLVITISLNSSSLSCIHVAQE